MKKRNVWPWIVIGILVLVIILLVAFLGFFGSGQAIKSVSSQAVGLGYTLTGVKDVLCESYYLNTDPFRLYTGDPINKVRSILGRIEIPGLLDSDGGDVPLKKGTLTKCLKDYKEKN